MFFSNFQNFFWLLGAQIYETRCWRGFEGVLGSKNSTKRAFGSLSGADFGMGF